MTPVTIVDVAREAGVSISTVSSALNGRPGVAPTTRARVEEAASRLGWVPSVRGRSLSSKRAWAVGMVLQRSASVLEADPFFWGFISGVEERLDDRGYRFVLQTATTPDRMLERIRSLALSHAMDGIFLTDVRADDPRVPLLQGLELKAVAVNVDPATSALSTVGQAHAPALRELVDRLVELGHTRIAHVGGAPGYVHTIERERVWREALTARGLPDDLLVVGDFTVEGGMAAASSLLAAPEPPTAVVCANDLSAIGLMVRARSLGLEVPGDLSVTGFDGIPMARYAHAELTTVRTSPRELGRCAADVLLGQIDGDDRTDVTIAPAWVDWGQSVAPPRS